MKIRRLWLAPVLVLLCITGVRAAGMEQAKMIWDFTDSVAPAEQQAYEAGTKAFNQCLSQHGFKYAWTALNHQTGDTYTYSYVSDPVSWASFDEMDAAVKPCLQTAMTQVNPHLKSETSSFLMLRDDLSHNPPDLRAANMPPFVEVTYFTLKQGHYDAFVDAAKKIKAAADKTKRASSYQFLEVVDGGAGSPDFILVEPKKNWADFGTVVNPPLWKMVEDVYGKPQGTALHKTVMDALQDVSSHIDRYNADLTYKPSGQ